MTKSEFDKLYNEKLAQCLSNEPVKFSSDFTREGGIIEILQRLAIQQFINQLTMNADSVNVRNYDIKYSNSPRGNSINLSLEIEIFDNTTP